MLSQKFLDLKAKAEKDFETFVQLVRPDLCLGPIHSELFSWIPAEYRKKYKLVLMPREHYKSGTGALYASWRITGDPAIRILYLSSTSNLATKQLKAIKDIITCGIYRLFWPEMVTKEEAKREKWSETEMSVDHPLRRERSVRDSTVFTGGLTTSVTGLHCDLLILDDLVVLENAYTEEGRSRVALLYSLLAAVLTTDGECLVLGTRYHPLDLYGVIKEKKVQIFDDNGNVISEYPLYDIFERVVEDKGDGTGNFLWPRAKAADGRWFGFTREILAEKKSNFEDQTQFFAQYYNNPNLGDNAAIPKNCFQYYDKTWLTRNQGVWYFKDRRLNIYAAMDFAYTTGKKSDYSSLVVVGIDSANNIYILDIDRYQTGLMDVYYEHLLKMYLKWGFNRIVAETTAAQEIIATDLKVNYLRPNGIPLTVDTYKPHRYLGAKEERIDAALRGRYTNGQMWHFMGGNTSILEEELQMVHPPHDDVKDCLAIIVGHEKSYAPSNMKMYSFNQASPQEYTHKRFGGFA